MTTAEDVPAVFEDGLVTAVADDHDVPRDRLTSLLADHQSGVADLPGVENLVYEWRRQFDATVVDSTETAYYVAAPPWVWEEFAESLDATEAEAGALADVHARHVEDRVEGHGGALPDGDQHAFVVLDR